MPHVSPSRTIYHPYNFLFPPVFGLMLGIFLAKKLGLWIIFFIAFSPAFAFLSLKYWYKKRLSNSKVIVQLIAFTTTCIFGAFLLKHQETSFNYDKNLLFSKNWTITGSITDKKLSTAKQFPCCLRIRINSLACRSFRLSAAKNKEILCYVQESPITIGDNVCISNVRFANTSNTASNKNTSFEDYLCKEGLVATAFLQSSAIKKIDAHSHFSIQSWIDSLKHKIHTALTQKLDATGSILFDAVFFGAKDPNRMAPLQKKSSFWGISHFLARSGVHLVFVILLWNLLLQFIPLPFVVKQSLLVGIVLIYHFMTYPSISFIRALLVFLGSKCALIFGHQSSFLHLLCLTGFVLLLQNPMLLFFLDFQLSFGLTFALSWYADQQKIYS